MEEAGEMAAEVLMRTPEFHKRPDKAVGSLEHEMIDVLIYVCALANACGIDLGI